jgi:hypothetical protein
LTIILSKIRSIHIFQVQCFLLNILPWKLILSICLVICLKLISNQFISYINCVLLFELILPRCNLLFRFSQIHYRFVLKVYRIILTLRVVWFILSQIRPFHWLFLLQWILNEIWVSHITLIDDMHFHFAICIDLGFWKLLVYAFFICFGRSKALIIFYFFLIFFHLWLIFIFEINIDDSWMVMLIYLSEFLI